MKSSYSALTTESISNSKLSYYRGQGHLKVTNFEIWEKVGKSWKNPYFPHLCQITCKIVHYHSTTFLERGKLYYDLVTYHELKSIYSTLRAASISRSNQGHVLWKIVNSAHFRSIILQRILIAIPSNGDIWKVVIVAKPQNQYQIQSPLIIGVKVTWRSLILKFWEKVGKSWKFS